MNLKQLREERANKIAAATALFDKAKAENRSLSDEEKAQVRSLQTEAEALKGDIELAEVQERNAAEAAGRQQPVNSHNTQEARDLASYSLLNAVRSTLPPSHDSYKELSGIEKEMHQEAVRESRDLGEAIKGVGIPQMLVSKRDNSVTMPTQPEDGAAVVQKDVRPILDLLRPKSVLRELGAQFLTGLVGNIGIPSMAAGAVSTWKPEVAELDKSNQKFAEAEFAPHRLGTYALRSKQFLAQTSPAIEQMLRQDLENSIIQALEIAAINGSGTNNQPLGLLNNPGINTLSLGTNGAAFTRGTAIALMAAVMGENIPLTNPGYLMNVDTMAKLMDTKVDEGSGQFLMNSMDSLFGYKAAVTTNTPGDLTKGSGTNLSALIFGNWRDLLIGQWGGLDITTDPYTRAEFGQVRIIIQSFFDVMAQRPKAFAAVKDIVTT